MTETLSLPRRYHRASARPYGQDAATTARSGTRNRAAALLLYGVAALAPLPYGSYDALWVAVWCLGLGAGLVCVSPAGLGRERGLMLAGIATVAGAYLLVLHEQLAANPWLAGPDPIWARAAALIGREGGADGSMVRGEPLAALGRPFGCLAALALGLLVGSDRHRARRLVQVVAWSGLAYAAYGIAAALLEPTLILGAERPAYVGNALGTFVNRRNTAATYFGCCAAIWLLLAGEAIRQRVPRRERTWRRLPAALLARPSPRILVPLAAVFVCVAALLMTGSRAGAGVSLAALCAATVAMRPRTRGRRRGPLGPLLVAGVAALLLLQLSGGILGARFGASGLSGEGRIDVYRATLPLIAAHPWFGTGLGTFAAVFPAYRGVPPGVWGIWEMAHSTPLEMAAELGLPLTALAGAALVLALARLSRGARTRQRDRTLPLIGAVVLSLAVAHSCVDFSLQIPGFALVLMALVGAMLAQSVSSRPDLRPVPRARLGRDDGSADILIYALNYAPEPFGVGRYTGDLGRYLAAQGHRVRVLTALPHYPEWQVAEPYRPGRYARERRGGASVTRCPVLLRRPMRGLWRLLAPFSFAVTSLPPLVLAVLRRRPDVIVCVEPTLFAAPAALVAAWCTGARTILHVQDLEVDAAFAVGHLAGGLSRRAALACEGFLLRRFDQVVTISGRMVDQVARKGVPRSRLTLVRNWIDLDAIRPLEGRNRYRDERGWPDALHIALYSGSVGAKQALDVALDAARLLADRSDLLFVIAGDGPAKAGLVERYGGLPNVAFFPPQPEARMREFLTLASIHLLPQSRGIADLVLPSKLGGMLASGRPVLATADAGTELHEVLAGTAILVPAGDGAAIARELALFVDRGGHHPAIGDGRRLAASLSRDACLHDLAAAVIGPAQWRRERIAVVAGP